MRVLNKVVENTNLDLYIPFEKNSDQDIKTLLYGSDEILIEDRSYGRFRE